MLGLFSNVKPLVKSKSLSHTPRPDNVVFKLHYKVHCKTIKSPINDFFYIQLTFAAMLVCSILVSSYSYIDSSGSAIQCMTDSKAPLPDPVINRYCWITSTFTLPKHFKGVENEDFLHYGVGNEEVILACLSKLN